MTDPRDSTTIIVAATLVTYCHEYPLFLAILNVDNILLLWFHKTGIGTTISGGKRQKEVSFLYKQVKNKVALTDGFN